MEPSVFKFVLRYSKRQQILLLLGTAASLPFLYVSLDLPKTIINEAIGGRGFPKEVLGYQFDQIPYLLLLSTAFLVLVLINGGFKYFLNVFRGVVGERMLRRLRYLLIARVMRFPLRHFRKHSQGEIIAMITAETEPIGGFVGSAFALPAFQGGTLLTILVFMFVQDPTLGIATIALYPVQAYLIPKLQRRVNALNKRRIIQVRDLSDRINDVVTGIPEVHAHDTSQLELADFSERMGKIYNVRLDIYVLKFLIKFLNNFIDKLTPFFFYSIGGYLVIKGSLSLGALVAVIAAYKDISAPWKELLKYYQTTEDVRVKYALLAESFEPPGMLEEHLQTEEPVTLPSLSGALIATNLHLGEEEHSTDAYAGGANVRLDLPGRIAVIGRAGSGTERLATLLAAVDRPASGTITIGELRLNDLPETVTGRRIGYVGQESRLRFGSLRDNLLYSLKHRPLRPATYDERARGERERVLAEAAVAGNSSYDINADWVDYEAAGVSGPLVLTDKIVEVLTTVELDQDVYEFGLRGTIDPAQEPELAQRILEARRQLRDQLKDPRIAPLVEPFDWNKWNENMTVAENLLFGTPCDESFNLEHLSENSYVRDVLRQTGLLQEFIIVGRQIAEIMVEVFADVEPGSEVFERFSFIRADDLPAFQTMLARTEGLQAEQLTEDDRNMLLSLPFKVIPARHRLGLADEPFIERLLAARHALAKSLKAGAVEFFDAEKYNPAISIQDNILFGRLAYGKARSEAQVGSLISEVVQKLGLRRAVMEVGLDYPVGIAGARLSGAQRQKLAIARGVLKRPDLFVVDQATAALDRVTQDKIMKNLFGEFEGRGLVWVLHRAELGAEFDYTVVLESGKVVEQGRFAELDRPGSILKELVVAG